MKNRVTISRGGEVPARKIDKDGVDRSFAQPLPEKEEELKIQPKAHASKKDEEEAIKKNTKDKNASK